MLAVSDIGEVTAESIYTFFREDRILKVLEKFENLGLKIKSLDSSPKKKVENFLVSLLL